MSEIRSLILILQFVRELEKVGSFAGETHIQKGLFFAQSMYGVHTGFKFVPYRYGPFSFEIRQALNDLQAMGLLTVIPDPNGYGVHYAITERGKKWLKMLEGSIRDEAETLRKVAEKFGRRTAKELELLATIQFVRRYLDEKGEGDKEKEIVSYTRSMKPWLKGEEILSGLEKLRQTEKG
jgi:hypothetical protein